MPLYGTVIEVRDEQKARVLQQGGRVLKFTNNSGKLYFRYYFPHPSQLTWNKLTSGLRVLFSIASMDIYIRYTDPDGSQIIVNDDSGLKIMFDETKGSDVIHVEVISEDNPLSMPNSIPGIDKPPSMSGTPTMAMPMPAPGFPGMEASRPGSAMSMGNNAAAGPPRPPAQPMAMSMAQPMPPNSGNSNHPGPVSQNMPGPFVAPGPAAHGVPQGAYGRMDNFSTATLPPPNPQEPLK